MAGFFEMVGTVFGGAGGMVGGAVAGGAVEGGGGAVVGSVVPGYGTAAGAVVGAGHGAFVGGAAGLVGGAAVGNRAGAWVDDTAFGRGVNDGLAATGDAVRSAATEAGEWIWGDDEAEATQKVAAAAKAAATVACARCAQNPCAALACGVPGSRYRGGAHGCVGLSENKIGEAGSLHSHHMPADKYSPLPRPVGPAIQMDAADHRMTASYGSKVDGPSYFPQRQALRGGNTMAAFAMDVADAKRIAIASGDPAKYDGAIAQATAYARCLQQNGIIR